MTERIKTLLKELYPASNPSEGVDFDKSGTVEKSEAVKDFNGDGIIDDVDYGSLTFNNRNSFIYHNGINRWREVEKYWDDAAKKTVPAVATNEPAISANNNAGDEAQQNRIVNDQFDGRANELNEKQAQNVVETQKDMEELHSRYPSMKMDGMRPSDAKRALAVMKEVEEFNPRLAEGVKKITYSVDDCGHESALVNSIFMGGCADGDDVHINQLYKVIPLGEEDVVVHEATHVYHGEVGSDDLHELASVGYELSQHVKRNYSLSEEKRSGKPRFFLKETASIDGRCRDIIEMNLKKRELGEPYDTKLIGLYEKWNSVRENGFNYQWNHVNQKHMPDGDHDDVDGAGKRLEQAEGELEALTNEAFGEEDNDTFWYDSFYEGGDRRRPVVSGRTEELIRNCPDAAMKKRLEGKMEELDGAARGYRKALSERQLSRAVSTTWPYDASLVWKGVPLVGPAEGLAEPYGATNNEEAVATFVTYVYANGKLPYKSGDTRHNEMVKNYARLLRDRGFIRNDHPAVASL